MQQRRSFPVQNGFKKEYRDEGTDLATVESQRNDLIPEEFPEGPYGTPLEVESLGKSSPWRRDQRSPDPYGYENRELHEGMQRNYPGDHETHDESI
ncbi:hypothetical protein SD70_04730 [Gordoniibacillus kamchatkensis]|uniref:Cytosolic protein n=1 Tax=Gordoniibacillus kamchatkensis TaxID=1590651 RepID=A0ABR5AMZ9_9BACL|nr:hypothetical protein SD70_04730 [Paenibacillus sp. VKM B-2647]